ncbi:SDR family oxidoreductase [Sandarakinorhabdus sp.]|uniref:SDR family NAD(P)-dependent oxidoreductase n=1 Tax=Sandarakinorhabdus sp. TaxID=1916663 RepID=UPI00286E8644|nr:SDR family oxidoreductase [Sandarakinorhabdus sp.]
MIDWVGQVVLVTGAASGIGRALADALTLRGARVVGADIADAGGDALHADLARPEAAGQAVAAVIARHGRIDAVFANAGIGYNRRLLKADLDDPRLDALWEINMLSATRLAKPLEAAARAQGSRARIVITGSENSLSLPDSIREFGNGLYAASKHGVLILAEWLASECRTGNRPLDVHVLLPGGVYTGLTAGGLGPDPAGWPADMGVIMPDRAAEIALRGLDLGLFYIPTHAHLIVDMRARFDGMTEATRALGLGQG